MSSNKLKNLFTKYFLTSLYETAGTAAPISLKSIFIQKILRINGKAYWPVHHSSVVTSPQNIKIGIGTAPGLSPGCYIQGGGRIYIGDYTIVAPNVGIISANHDLHDQSKHIRAEVHIGNYCWIGMNSIVLPNVTLGDHTIVAAGSVVTKSFPDGYCVVGGNPARVIKVLEKELCVKYANKFEYYGYIKKSEFEGYRGKYLNV